jgi:hypothetical protein
MVIRFLAIFLLLLLASCQLKPTLIQDKEPGSASATDSGLGAASEIAPDTKTFSERDLDGSAVMVDGTPTVARSIVTAGESRRPVALTDDQIAFTSRRIGLDRWQIFEADLKKGIERRVSYDAGDVEPIGMVGLGDQYRLLISSSSRAVRSSNRLLTEYQSRFLAKPKKNRTSELEHELLIEIPAAGKRGTVWQPISGESAGKFVFARDREGINGLLLALPLPTKNSAREKVYRLGFSKNSKNPGAVSWQPLIVDRPNGVSDNAALVSVQIFPDTGQALWANGSAMWTTDMSGKSAQRVGDDTTVVAGDLAIDPSGQWIVFSTPTANRGLNLATIHRTGKCYRNLTEIPGDEYEASFSPNSHSLFFTQSQAGITGIARVSFATSSNLSTSCQ